MYKRFILSIISLLLFRVSAAQEVMISLQENALLKENMHQHLNRTKSTSKPLELPFFDDFSERGVYPNPSRWADNKVFVNNTYPAHPPTLGVATFDALDEMGKLYTEASSAKFIADVLTSVPIRLDSLTTPSRRIISPADSVYFSFYFQPEGYGFAPNESDSLVLEFFVDHPIISQQKWVRVWSSPGMNLNDFYAKYKTYFLKVMVPITNPDFFRSGFRFRFYNYASIMYPTNQSFQSNRDHWHIDYVFLHLNRRKSEAGHPDLALVANPGSLLKRYYQMPYKQYKQNFVNEMADNLVVSVANLNNQPVLGSYQYAVRGPAGDTIKSYTSGTQTILPFSSSGYAQATALARPQVGFVFPLYAQSQTSFSVTHWLRNSSGLKQTSNDTLKHIQFFGNYFAYDDGTAEAGYGLNYAGGQLAYKFQLNTPDTLSALHMFFNHILNNQPQRYFHLKVWNDLGGKPNKVIYSQEFLQPLAEEGFNTFTSYTFTDNVTINNTTFPGLVFYVGWQQVTADLLNVGFDRNTNNKSKVYYNLGGIWYNSMLDGSVMMRPVMGALPKANSQIAEHIQSLKVSPNPVSHGLITLTKSENVSQAARIKIYDMLGSLVMEQAFSNMLDIAKLSPGVYLIQLLDTNRAVTGISRFVVAR